MTAQPPRLLVLRRDSCPQHGSSSFDVFIVAADVLDPLGALYHAVQDFISMVENHTATDAGREWVDRLAGVPDEIWERYGISPLHRETIVCIQGPVQLIEVHETEVGIGCCDLD